MNRRASIVQVCAALLCLGLQVDRAAADETVSRSETIGSAVEELVNNYCLDCHAGDESESHLDLESVSGEPVALHTEDWEKVVRRLRSRQMPPSDALRPDEAAYTAAVDWLVGELDRRAAEHPTPGRTDAFRRLTRTEYQNAVRDLLSLEIDATEYLPKDESSLGFDNITVGELTPTLLNRYLSAAQKISRLAVGASAGAPGGDTIRVPPDVTQEERVEGLPFGTRGGTLIPYHFPSDGQYEIQVRLTRDRNEQVEGLKEPHELEVLLDGKRVALFTVKPPRGAARTDGEYDQRTHADVDRHLTAHISVSAGPHQLGVTFLKKPSSLLQTKRQPLNVHFNMYRHPRIGPAVFQVSINGPFDASGPGDTPSRRRLFVCRPDHPDEEEDCAKRILAKVMRRALRRPVDGEDFRQPLKLYREARVHGDFEAGIEAALSSVLVHPEFLFRIEQDPRGGAPGTVYRVDDVALASRLSFFLWSSIPDDELLDAAESGQLGEPGVLEQQARRMLQDERAAALVTNFASQWLHLRNLESTTPDMRLFPDFDDNLRQALKRETELFCQSMLREDRSVLDLLGADYTYLNERLAKHYGIPHVYGSRFRRVSLDPSSRRGGILRHGSILTVTSYATRTSPVIRGKWILENILGTPPPPPPENIPALKDNTVSASLSGRERLAEHRANVACASCHDVIDPVGFSLENFDAVGRWRDREEGKPIDASGGLPDGSRFTGIDGLEQGLRERPEVFVGTLAERMLTYALGRGVEPFDGPAIRQIVRDAEADGYRLSSLIVGIVRSIPFQMRTSQ